MTHNEIRLVKHLTEVARRVKHEHPTWQWADWALFQNVMAKQPRPKSSEFEVNDRAYMRCIRMAFVEVHRQ